MRFDRREFLAASVAAATAACGKTIEQRQAGASASGAVPSGIPGPYPGRVVAVHHPGSILSGAYQPEPVHYLKRGT